MDLFEIQDDTINYLRSDGYLNNVPMFVANKANLAQLVEEALGKIGLVVVLEPVQGTFGHVTGQVFCEPTFAFTITENPFLNRHEKALNKPAERVMIRIAWLLRNGSTPPAPMYSRNFQLVDDLGDTLTYQLNAVQRGKIEVTP